MNHIAELTHEDIQILLQLASELNENSTDNPELFCNKAKILSQKLPLHIKNILTRFSTFGSPSGFLLIKTIPIENLPPTPDNNNQKIGEQTMLARIQAILISFFSELIAYEAEGYGRLFQDVVPTQSMSKNQTSLGSNTELEIHTEQAFSKLRPDFLSLACLRGDKQALTYILPVQTIMQNILEEEKLLLREPLWNTGVDLSFKLHGNEFIEGDIRGPLSILHLCTFKTPTSWAVMSERGDADCAFKMRNGVNDLQLVFDQDLMSGTCEKSTAMIQKIIDIYYKHRLNHNLCPGDIIIVDNRHAVHGRSPFFPKFDGNDRFLIRCFSTLEYDKSSYARVGRMVKAIYS